MVDFTYMTTWSGTAFTELVTDVFPRRIVGWRTAAAIRTLRPSSTATTEAFAPTEPAADTTASTAGTTLPSTVDVLVVGAGHAAWRRRGCSARPAGRAWSSTAASVSAAGGGTTSPRHPHRTTSFPGLGLRRGRPDGFMDHDRSQGSCVTGRSSTPGSRFAGAYPYTWSAMTCRRREASPTPGEHAEERGMRREIATAAVVGASMLVDGRVQQAPPRPGGKSTSSRTTPTGPMEGTPTRSPSRSAPTGLGHRSTTGASDLGPTDTNGGGDVYLRDLRTGETTLVSSNAEGADSANDGSGEPVCRPDGTKLAFAGRATDLGPTDADPGADVYVRDLATAGLTRVPNAPDDCPVADTGDAQRPVFSADGTMLAFRQGLVGRLGRPGGAGRLRARPHDGRHGGCLTSTPAASAVGGASRCRPARAPTARSWSSPARRPTSARSTTTAPVTCSCGTSGSGRRAWCPRARPSPGARTGHPATLS